MQSGQLKNTINIWVTAKQPVETIQKMLSFSSFFLVMWRGQLHDVLVLKSKREIDFNSLKDLSQILVIALLNFCFYFFKETRYTDTKRRKSLNKTCTKLSKWEKAALLKEREKLSTGHSLHLSHRGVCYGHLSLPRNSFSAKEEEMLSYKYVFHASNIIRTPVQC